jgi:hypothetical protein
MLSREQKMGGASENMRQYKGIEERRMSAAI